MSINVEFGYIVLQDFAQDLRELFTNIDALGVGDMIQPGVDPQAAAASMASDAGVNKLMLQVQPHTQNGPHAQCRCQLDILHDQCSSPQQALAASALAEPTFDACMVQLPHCKFDLLGDICSRC